MPFENVSVSNLKDFPVECEINQGSSFPVLDKYCGCGQQLGYYQRLIENKIGTYLEKFDVPIEERNDLLSEARIHVFKELGITKDCCLRSLTMYNFMFFNDICGVDCYVDTTLIGADSGNLNRHKMRNNYNFREINKNGNKGLVGYYPVSYDNEFNISEYENELFNIPRKGKVLPYEDENPSLLIFPKMDVSKEIELIKTCIPVPFSEK